MKTYVITLSRSFLSGHPRAGEPIFDEHVSAWFTTVKDPKKLRTEKVTPKELEEIEKKVYFRYHQLRCKLIKQKLVTPFGIT